MPSKIVIIGAGFAGVWSALSAQRLINLRNKEQDIEILVIAPEPWLTMRPRLYEANASAMKQPLATLFKAAGIGFVQGTVETIDTNLQTVHVQSSSGDESYVHFDRLILAAGSAVVRPKSVAGLDQHAFDIDSLAGAIKLEAHLKSLESLPASKTRDTVVICGGGFTGIEMAAELPNLLKHMANPNIVLVESAPDIGPELGAGPRPTIMKALGSLGVELKLGAAVTTVDVNGVQLSSGERIDAMTVVWTAGMRATHLTQQIPGEKDTLSRLYVDLDLRVTGCEHVFATGDAAHAVTDTEGHIALMSCQHANILGRFSGHNAAADLLSESTVPYSQPGYATCLDLGPWGALLARGWERDVKMTGDVAKQVKRYINQKLIVLPEDAMEAMEAAEPASYSMESLYKTISQGTGIDVV
ncbi:pyridine nucleotide-disulfide oxidoreductase family [Fusarium sporotrichioides]|uniref:Pyridine nucleotide-disulfide oxidoreductase family n=1 Tax=Fusarium sporotrichioides TaxID=5514 RepID=A0A395RXD6_FUSSP|nr:pyridine nucleotide-disulfide oxidoreductase family [Fusarium sporotrichioides]